MAILDLEDDGKKPTKVPVTKQVEPGFLEPGSRSDAIIRGFSSGATLGLAPKISAGINSLFGNGDYKSNLKQYLDANRTAQETHPTASLVSNAVGSLPSTIAAGVGSLPMQIAKGAGMSALDTYGNTTKTGMDAAKDVAQGAAIGGGTTAALPVLGKIAKGATNLVVGTSNPTKLAAAVSKLGDKAPMVPPSYAPQSAKDAYRKEIIDMSNAANKGSALKEILPEMAKQSVYGAGAGFVGSGGDMDRALQGGIAGATSGALTGGSRVLSGDSAKLRMPGKADELTSILDAGVRSPAAGVVNQFFGQQMAGVAKELGGTSTSPFGKLTDYMKQAQGTTNPAVQQVAEQAQQIADSNDPDAKRKAAMVLQDTPEGRAVGNSSSNVRDLD